MIVAIDAQLLPGGISGGVEQFVMGLVHALGRLRDGPEEYIIIGPWQDPGWLHPHLGESQRIVSGPRPRASTMDSGKRLLGPLRAPAGKVWREVRRRALGPRPASRSTIPDSDGFYERLGADVVHFPTNQRLVRCDVPMVFNPHDLQHLHYPQFFAEEQIAWREATYRAGCSLADAVAAESRWVKEDIVRQYGTIPDKIHVIPRGSPTELYDPPTDTVLASTRHKLDLPEAFALFPAQTWPHKNHVRLLEAVALLRDRDGVRVNLVCTGRKNDFWPVIRKRIRSLRLHDRVRFPGYVSAGELRALYRLAEFVVFPSLFEGGGFPILEAFHEGTPVACADVTSLPEYGGDAVLLFDPTSVQSIAQALVRMRAEPDLRAELSEKGSSRISQFTWEQTARQYRALYRVLAGRPLSDEDRHLLVGEAELGPDIAGSPGNPGCAVQR
jgi:glycosyltransferase involved in cell wall biosynthesis